jgi:hypothetical protein
MQIFVKSLHPVVMRAGYGWLNDTGPKKHQSRKGNSGVVNSSGEPLN